jgi:hypothetical protein
MKIQQQQQQQQHINLSILCIFVVFAFLSGLLLPYQAEIIILFSASLSHSVTCLGIHSETRNGYLFIVIGVIPLMYWIWNFLVLVSKFLFLPSFNQFGF